MALSNARDIDSCSDAPPAAALDILFIHHSVGGQLLADPGVLESHPDALRSLHRTHPNGGGLRRLLEDQGYRVHEASYGSEIGARTDLFDWLPKFRDSMPRIRATHRQDEQHAVGTNRIVMFKSCYPNNAFTSDAAAASARGQPLTLSRARVAFTELRGELAKHPDVLFVYLTAPPLRDDSGAEPTWKALAKRALGRDTWSTERRRAATLAREFNEWINAADGWLSGYRQRNVAVFDYFGLLTAGTEFLQFASGGGMDNHPNSAAQRLAATRIVPFVNRAVRFAGLVG
jgi:hypothetical protein